MRFGNHSPASWLAPIVAWELNKADVVMTVRVLAAYDNNVNTLVKCYFYKPKKA